ncbi:hypothetical protein SUGI_0102450 [Cryptomeria japonica]|nr:hypothetical protein SUGI_0102450 [Cryptomeria japonica]
MWSGLSKNTTALRMDESLFALLPSLPHEIVLQCIARLPLRNRAIASCVSRAWAMHAKTNLQLHLFAVLSISQQNIVYSLQFLTADSTGSTSIAANNNQLFLPQLNQTKGGLFSYDVGEGRWKSVEFSPGKRCRRFCCAEMKEFVYLCGGLIHFTGEASRSAFRYDSRNNQWEKLPDMIMPRIDCAGVNMNDKFYAIGGYCHSPGGFPQIHVSAERFDPQIGQWTLLPNFCAKGLRYAEDSAITESDFAVVENKRLFAVQAQSNEVMELDSLKEEWRHLGFIGGMCEMRDCGSNYKILGVGSELWAIQYRVGKSIWIYSCKPGESESAKWRRIDIRGLERFDHVLTGTTFEL